jgi:hypothetical protein
VTRSSTVVFLTCAASAVVNRHAVVLQIISVAVGTAQRLVAVTPSSEMDVDANGDLDWRPGQRPMLDRIAALKRGGTAVRIT